MSAPRPTLLLTRPRAQSRRFAEACRARLGADIPIVISPVLEIRFRDTPVDMRGVSGVIATSGNGIEALARLADLDGRIAYCVGDRTAEVAKRHGMRAISAQGDVSGLIDAIRRAGPVGPLLYASGAVVRCDIDTVLAAEGYAIRNAILYDQVAIDLSDAARALLKTECQIVLPLFSPRSAALTGGAIANCTATLDIVALSAAVADAWSGPAPKSLAIATSPDAKSMLDALRHYYGGASA